MGMHSGILTEAECTMNKADGRMHYSGECLAHSAG